MDKSAERDRGARRGLWPIAACGLWAVMLLGGMGLAAGNMGVVLSMPAGRVMRCSVLRLNGTELQWPLIKVNAVDVIGLPGSRQTWIRIGWFHLGSRDVSRSLSGTRLLVPGSSIRAVRLWGQWWWLAEARAWIVILGVTAFFGSIALAVLLAALLRDKSGGRMLEIGETPMGGLGMTRVCFRGGSIGNAALIVLSLGIAAAGVPVFFSILFNRCIPALLPVSLSAAVAGTLLMFWAMILFQRPGRALELHRRPPNAPD